MKLSVKCRVCGDEYNLNQNFKPCFCAKCGAGDILVTDRGVSRLRAETAMQNLDELMPTLEEAYRAYIEVAAKWESEMQILRQYVRRGIISEEEMGRYLGVARSAGTLKKELAACRKKKKEGKSDVAD